MPPEGWSTGLTHALSIQSAASLAGILLNNFFHRWSMMSGWWGVLRHFYISHILVVWGLKTSYLLWEAFQRPNYGEILIYSLYANDVGGSLPCQRGYIARSFKIQIQIPVNHEHAFWLTAELKVMNCGFLCLVTHCPFLWSEAVPECFGSGVTQSKY